MEETSSGVQFVDVDLLRSELKGGNVDMTDGSSTLIMEFEQSWVKSTTYLTVSFLQLIDSSSSISSQWKSLQMVLHRW